MKKNTRSFWSWQGNNLNWWKPTSYISVAIIIFLTLIIFLFNKKIKSWFLKKETEKILFFKDINVFLQFFGFVGLIYTFSRIIIYSFYSYPIWWEYLHLHLCRAHFVAIMIIFILKKKEYVFYILYLSWLGSIIGIGLGSLDYTKIIENGTMPIWNESGIKRYNVGPDNFFFWDFSLFHISVAIIPSLILAGTYKKMTTRNFYRMLFIYILFTICIWLFNYATFQSPQIGWRSNNWYIGKNDVNPNYLTIGWLSSWPQNVFTIPILGIIFIYIIHFSLMTFRGSFKLELKNFIKDHNLQMFKSIFKFKK